MATIDLNNVQFWKPPSNTSLQKQRKAPSNSATGSRNQLVPLPNKANLFFERNKQSACTVPVIEHQGRDFKAQPKHGEARVQGLNHDPAHSVSDADDDLPSVKALLDSYVQTEIAEIGEQGTQDRPLILDDDDLDPAADPKASVGAGPVFALEMSNPVDPSCNEWWDVEAGCFASEDLHLLASSKHGSLASTLTQDKLRARQQSLGSTQDQINLHGDDRATQNTPEDLAPQSQFTILDESSGEGSRGHISDSERPKRDMLMAFEREELLNASSSPDPRQPFQLPIDKDHGQGWSELQSDLHPRSQEEKCDPRQQQEQEMAVEVAVDEIREAGLEDGDLNAHNVHNDDNDSNDDTGERGQRGEKRQYNHTRSSTRIICQSESSGRSDHADDKDEENPRPMKRSRVSPETPPPEHSLTPCLGEPHSTTLSLTAQLERDEQPPQADHRYLSTPADSEYHSTLPRSQLPSLRVTPAESASALVAEYREWPFQGYLKRVTVNGQTTFNLEFSLPCISEHLELPSHSKNFGASSSNSDAQPVTSRITTSGKPVHLKRPPPASAPSSRSRFSAEDDDSKEWVVERILGERQKKLPGRGSRTRLEYRVKWQGDETPTWEPATALEDTVALDAYLKSREGSDIKGYTREVVLELPDDVCATHDRYGYHLL